MHRREEQEVMYLRHTVGAQIWHKMGGCIKATAGVCMEFSFLNI